MNKLDYDDYFLTLAYVVAQRSPDPSTKCGAVLVSSERRILSTGYNGPIKGVDDTKVPTERPAKYVHFLHAEENCLLTYSGCIQDLEGSVMYVTGAPCHKCLRMILQKGVREIVYSNGNLAVMQDAAEQDNCKNMLEYTSGVTVRVLPNLPQICELLQSTESYIVRKNPDKFKLEDVSWKSPKTA